MQKFTREELARCNGKNGAPDLYARYCDTQAKAIARYVDYVVSALSFAKTPAVGKDSWLSPTEY
jgi:hypothetical protein